MNPDSGTPTYTLNAAVRMYSNIFIKPDVTLSTGTNRVYMYGTSNWIDAGENDFY